MCALQVMKLSDRAFLPWRSTDGSAGYDLFSPYDYIVCKNSQTAVATDIAIKMPLGCYGRIAPRSGLAFYHDIHVLGGVIDRDYRGNIIVLLFNLGKSNFKISRGDRIAQLILERYSAAPVQEVTSLGCTERGRKGFGSSSVKDSKNWEKIQFIVMGNCALSSSKD